MLRVTLLSFVVLVFHPHAFAAASPHCHPEERLALLQLNTKHDWNKSTDCCTWEGITCDGSTGLVIGIRFFIGTVDTIAHNGSLFSLCHLERLILYGNDLIIDAPTFRSLALNLTNLRELEMSFNNMSSVPPVYLANLSSSLESLKLISCSLRGEFSDTVFHFPKLELLDLSGNALSGRIPWSFFNLGRLTTLSLSRNKFDGQLPDLSGETGNFSLERLLLDHNKLRGFIPVSMFWHLKLVIFDVSSNNLEGIVELGEVSKLKELFYLDLSSNKNISLSFNNSVKYVFDKIWYLSLSSCNIAEFPRFLRSVKQLQFLDLSNNRIRGTVPDWLLEVGKPLFVSLNLSRNSLTHIGPVSGDVLQFLDLRFNFFSGNLPIPSADFLRFFSVSRNRFSGKIPSSICNLTFLEVLDLSYNNITGEIPQCIGNFSDKLSVIDLRSNELHGSIPTNFEKGISLRNLNLNGNRLEGEVPRSLMDCSNLEVLDLGNNALNDTFPVWLESMPALQVLILRANKFHGSIGNPMSRFPFLSLRIMDLSYNEFRGDLPTKYIASFKAMQMAIEEIAKMSYMGQEYYEDSVMVTMKGLDLELVKIQTIFTTIDLSSNDFSGDIPESLGKLESLKGLNLSHNVLTGNLPSSLGNLSNLEWLDLSSNELSGKIPNELLHIHWLSFLNLSHNQLEGPIPSGNQFNTFGNASFMGNLDLCGFPLSKDCEDERMKSSVPTLDPDEDDSSNGINWKIVMMGYSSGLVIGISIGYRLLYSNGKFSWISGRILRKKYCSNFVEDQSSPWRSY